MVYITEFTEYHSFSFYWIGWRWGYAIMHIRDTKEVLKIRLAKVKIKRNFPETKMFEWVDLDPNEIINLTQVQKINFKTEREVIACFRILRRFLSDLNEVDSDFYNIQLSKRETDSINL